MAALFLRSRPKLYKSKFSSDEDEKLKSLVQQYGASDFDFIASKMANRNARQCRDRWMNYLSPESKKAPWTETEEQLLMKLYQKYGAKWVKIGKEMERTDPDVKNRYLIIERRERKKERDSLGIRSHSKKIKSATSKKVESPPLIKDEKPSVSLIEISEDPKSMFTIDNTISSSNAMWESFDDIFQTGEKDSDMFSF